jgi:hypothetical protein
MRELNPNEKRTIRLASIGLAVYLAVFGGFQVWKKFAAKRAEYQALVAEADRLKLEMERYETRALLTAKFMERYRIEPEKLTRNTVVAQASAAIQKSGTGMGLQIGPVRESPARGSDKELAAIQLEAAGPVPALLGFLHGIESIGFPVIVDSVQMNSEPSKPGQLKMNLTLIILDYDQWKKGEAPRA